MISLLIAPTKVLAYGYALDVFNCSRNVDIVKIQPYQDSPLLLNSQEELLTSIVWLMGVDARQWKGKGLQLQYHT